VDDQAPLRLLDRVNLEPEGISVAEATDGRSGLECAARDSPDLILLDTEMPGLVGWQVAAALRADDATRAIPFVFVTARARYRDRLRGLELGAVDYIRLPTNPVTLAAHVRSLLEQTPEELEALRRHAAGQGEGRDRSRPRRTRRFPCVPRNVLLRTMAPTTPPSRSSAALSEGQLSRFEGRAPGCSPFANRRKKNRPFCGGFMELAGLEPATSWVRSRRYGTSERGWLSHSGCSRWPAPTSSPTLCGSFATRTTQRDRRPTSDQPRSQRLWVGQLEDATTAE
jgi:CheY-like chemotaxis protein